MHSAIGAARLKWGSPDREGSSRLARVISEARGCGIDKVVLKNLL